MFCNKIWRQGERCKNNIGCIVTHCIIVLFQEHPSAFMQHKNCNVNYKFHYRVTGMTPVIMVTNIFEMMNCWNDLKPRNDTNKFLIGFLYHQLTKRVIWNRHLMSICFHSDFPVTLQWRQMMHLDSSATQMIIQMFVKAHIKEIINAPHPWPSVG